MTVYTDIALLVAVVQQAGGDPACVPSGLDRLRQRLIADGQVFPNLLYVYRTEKRTTSQTTTASTQPRVRRLLAFLSADAAVSFAQSTGLARSPRLVALSPARLLAVFIRQPDFVALHIAYDDVPATNGLPNGWHLLRTDVLALFAIEANSA
ncbi:hypothetical protein [Chloroflexus aggregans]|uniref:Uncharacterized protein n=1 Tax=Chloroflexus aggregans (strain MD-66 / DSM 9485) TaxID=326427 RepID=B8G570_CHLAD|nr:hypothetical protein [Chloroflexus aggregans]ACL23703.1 conserved hypothetical protein [Chloroflexus aggregans DSM 9485]